MKNLPLIALIISILFGVTGCLSEQGGDFIGKWERVDTKFPGKEDVVDIKRTEGIFHIKRKYWAPFKGMRGSYVEDRLQAKAESNNTLLLLGADAAVFHLSYTLEDGHLHTGHGEYKRVQQ